MSVRRHLVGTLAVPLVLLPALSVLSGCGDGDDSVADPPVSSAPTSSPTTPERETPEHFIRRFYDAERRMENTGKTRTYRGLTRGCSSCASLADQVATYYQKGGFVRWRGLEIESIRAYRSSANGQTFAVKGSARPTSFKESSGASTSHLVGGRTTELVTIARDAESWRVTGFAKLGSN